MQVSNIKETPDAESTQVPMATSTAKKIKGGPTLDSEVRRFPRNKTYPGKGGGTMAIY